MKTTKEMIEIMQAYDEGKSIEFKPYGGDTFEWGSMLKDDNGNPIWQWAYNDYRVKSDAVQEVNDTDARFERIDKKLHDIEGMLIDLTNLLRS